VDSLGRVKLAGRAHRRFPARLRTELVGTMKQLTGGARPERGLPLMDKLNQLQVDLARTGGPAAYG